MIYVGHSAGVWLGVGVLRTTDAGKTWHVFSDPTLFLDWIRTIDVDRKTGNVVAGGFEFYYYESGKGAGR